MLIARVHFHQFISIFKAKIVQADLLQQVGTSKRRSARLQRGAKGANRISRGATCVDDRCSAPGCLPVCTHLMAVNLQNISKYLVYRPCLSLWLRFQEMTWCQLTSWKRRPEESLNLQGLHNNIYKSVILDVCIHTTFHSYLHHALFIFEKVTNSILCNFLFLLLCVEPPALPVAAHAEFRSG